MTVDYKRIFSQGLTDTSIAEAFGMARIKIYTDIDEIVRRRKLFLDINLVMNDWLDYNSENVNFEVIPPRKVNDWEYEQDEYWRGVYMAIDNARYMAIDNARFKLVGQILPPDMYPS